MKFNQDAFWLAFSESLQNLIKQGNVSSLKQQLLESTSDVECKDDIGNTPLLQAAHLGKSDCVEILLEIGNANHQVINVFGMKIAFTMSIVSFKTISL